MTDAINANWANDHAAPTDTNLELASSQSVTATRLDQLVYSQNCYIQIFWLNFSRTGDRTRNRSKLKSNALEIALSSYTILDRKTTVRLQIRTWRRSCFI